jgi:hypothetical protein
MKNAVSRRHFVRSGALAVGVFAASRNVFAFPQERPTTYEGSPIRLGLASYTFRNFSRGQMIGFMKKLNVFELNAKDVKDHLPMDSQQEAAALADYAAAGIRLHAAGTIYFTIDEDTDIRAKFEYCKRAGIIVIVAGDPAPETLPRIERFVKEYDIRVAIHVVQAIQEAGPRLHNVHMKDLTNFQSKESQVALGEGIMPVRKMFEALIKMRYTGFVDLEYEIHPDDPMPGVISSFAYMRGIAAGLG